jgi:hypothetical protein
MSPRAREPPTESPRTTLLVRRSPHGDDERVVEIIASLPSVPGGSRHALAGICNPDGQVYRRIELFSVLELFILIARLNALGFAQESGARAGKYAYDVVFHKVPKRRPSIATVA